jgi:beta-phosphoglucomutase family hydrolase
MFQIPPGVRGIIFDCDGTLADTMPIHLRAWKIAMTQLGGRISEEEFWSYAGIPTLRIIELLNEKHGTTVDPHQGTQVKEEIYGRMMHEVRPIAEVVDVAIAYHGKLPMAVASGGQVHVVRQTLSHIDMLDRFDHVVGAEDVKHGKPAPDVFLEAARRIGVAPAHCIVFEDADNGVIAAKAAGMAYVDIREYPVTLHR